MKRESVWRDEHFRALVLPLTGVFGVVLLVLIESWHSGDHSVFVAALTAVTTLTAGAGGHAAGAAKARSDASREITPSTAHPDPE